MPGTACYYAANQGDNPRKPVTDSLVPVCGLHVVLFFFPLFFFGSEFSLPLLSR